MYIFLRSHFVRILTRKCFFCTHNTFWGLRKHLKRFGSTKKFTNKVLRVRVAPSRVQGAQVRMVEAEPLNTCLYRGIELPYLVALIQTKQRTQSVFRPRKHQREQEKRCCGESSVYTRSAAVPEHNTLQILKLRKIYILRAYTTYNTSLSGGWVLK